MASVLEIDIPVITGDELRGRHQGEAEIRLAAGTVVTPTAWDYIREAGLHVLRDTEAAGTSAEVAGVHGVAPRRAVRAAQGTGTSPAASAVAAGVAPAPALAATATTAVVPAGTDVGAGVEDGSGAADVRQVQPAQMVCVARCDHPDSAFGCQTDEFGSGYAPGVTHAEAGAHGDALPTSPEEVEQLIQRITDLVMAELSKS